jgi:hypothetical protein
MSQILGKLLTPEQVMVACHSIYVPYQNPLPILNTIFPGRIEHGHLNIVRALKVLLSSK